MPFVGLWIRAKVGDEKIIGGRIMGRGEAGSFFPVFRAAIEIVAWV
jgi:hypothetical protein